MSKHFALTDDTIVVRGQTLYRIRATRDSLHAGAGEIGGYVWGLGALHGQAWVYDKARVSDKARVYGEALVSGEARVESALDVLCVPAHTSIHLPITASRQEAGPWLVKAGCWEGTVDELAELIARDDWVETAGQDVIDARPEMEAAVAMIRARIARIDAMKGRGDDE